MKYYITDLQRGRNKLNKKWDDLPGFMKSEDVFRYYNILEKKSTCLIAKRVFDIIISTVGLVILSPILVAISLLIVCDSKGVVFFG